MLVSGCHFGDCHYINANRWTQKRVEKVWKRLEKWHPAGAAAARMDQRGRRATAGAVMENMEQLRQGVTPEEIAATVAVLAQPYKGKAPPLPKAAEPTRESAAIPTPE